MIKSARQIHMKKRPLLRIIALVSLLSLGGCRLGTLDWRRVVQELKKATNNEVVVGTVDGEPITGSELRALIQSLPIIERQQLRIGKRRELLVRELTAGRVYARMAQKAGVEKDAVLQLQIRRIQDSMLLTAYRNRIAEAVIEKNKELQPYYQKNAPPALVESVIRRIVVTSPEQVQKVQNLLKAGKPFEDVARTLSIDKETAPHGGLLKKIPNTPEYRRLLNTISASQVTHVVLKSKNRYEIVERKLIQLNHVITPHYLAKQMELDKLIEEQMKREKEQVKVNINETEVYKIIDESLSQKPSSPPDKTHK
jgi:hypothetical protein